MLIGYARASTVDQEAGFEAQIRDLKAAGCEKVFAEQVSSVGKRPQLEAAIDYIRDTDQFVVTKLDRLARSTADAIDIERRLAAKGATLKIMNLTSTPLPRLAG